ncbi:hypothetical protein [Actinoplanes aureus]|uniref:Uncharacterized protein n=1 Tax=Actinoplanes aureus TaxID=2792083 RepID=A0A931G433_9ACTN|nr:hypothetical protein [Actinoplanes aureus]MBG0564869.1 hypothetical protein [Actinoplanes aureus]
MAHREGNFGWVTPEEESHRFINDRMRSFGTYLYGRRMYEVTSYWETAHTVPDQPDFMVECARIAGGGKRVFPDDVRADLELLEERRFANSVIFLRYGVCG